MVRNELGRNALSDLGEAMAAAKKAAPTHPHPPLTGHAPRQPGGGSTAGVADRVRDTVNGVAQGYVTAVGDVIAVVLRRKKPSVRPTGNQTARKTAGKVRGGIDDAADAVIEKTQEANSVKVRPPSRGFPARRLERRPPLSRERRAPPAPPRGAVKTAEATKSGAKGTVTSARKANGDTKSTAKRAMTTTARTASEAAKRTKTQAKRAATTTGPHGVQDRQRQANHVQRDIDGTRDRPQGVGRPQQPQGRLTACLTNERLAPRPLRPRCRERRRETGSGADQSGMVMLPPAP